MTRRGFALPFVLVCLLMAGSLALLDALDRGRRHRELAERQARIQAEEFARAALPLALGTQLTLGPWRIERGSGVAVAGPLGTLTVTGTTTRWSRR